MISYKVEYFTVISVQRVLRVLLEHRQKKRNPDSFKKRGNECQAENQIYPRSYDSSEHFKESDEIVNKKIKAALRNKLKAIVCVGESLKEREEDKTMQVIESQVKKGLQGLSLSEAKELIIAYEPVWAIGTGRNATPAQANEVHTYIRKLLSQIFNEGIASNIKILYGGSVKPSNSAELMSEKEIDGALVGGASLEADSFAEIVRSACMV